MIFKQKFQLTEIPQLLSDWHLVRHKLWKIHENSWNLKESNWMHLKGRRKKDPKRLFYAKIFRPKLASKQSATNSPLMENYKEL